MCVCVRVVSWHWPSPPPLMSGLVSMKPSKFHKPPDSTQPQGFSIDHGSFIIFL